MGPAHASAWSHTARSAERKKITILTFTGYKKNGKANTLSGQFSDAKSHVARIFDARSAAIKAAYVDNCFATIYPGCHLLVQVGVNCFRVQRDDVAEDWATVARSPLV